MMGRRAARAVAACDLEPRGLPESAILIVRRMPDPAPRKLLTDRLHWERRARAKLEELQGQAIRAAYRETPDSAPAVWFEDRAEMTACFVADIAAGQAHRRWWWRIPLREVGSITSAASAVLMILLREPHAIPEVMRLLQKHGALDLVLESLSGAAVELVLRVLEQTFAVHGPAGRSEAPGEPARGWPPDSSSPSAGSVVSDEVIRVAGSHASFAERRVDRLLLLARALRYPAGSPSRAELLRLYRGIEPAGEMSRSENRSQSGVVDSPAGELTQQAPALTDPNRRLSTVETECGGVLYLINLVKTLGLPASIHDGIGGWALLELLGRCLAGADCQDDALWRAIATLDGREPGDPAATSTRETDVYRLPVRWPCPATDVVYARARGQRLLLRHPLGFVVYDGPFADAPPLPSARSCRRRSRVPRQTTPALHRLLSFVVPYVAWWLREALGSDVDLRGILRIPGTVTVSPTHVDAVFGMDSVSLPVRMAGLDANPGWIPALGRVITYHFQ